MGRKKIKPEIATNNINKLCNLVNEKYNLKPNDVGSIEFHNDMCESAIIQICNQYRGYRQLIYGPEPMLKTYLRNILEDKIILNFWAI